MIREDILMTAKDYVTKDRQATHGSPEDNFEIIAHLWSAYMREKHAVVPRLGAEDVAWMMVLFKMARSISNNKHIDNYVDAAGYVACCGEIALRKDTA